ncbi:MAG: hypothetical protein IKJ13_02575 [Clostridia bacterium]|nr:hypothetical protein [Clostridia bacterium]
MKVTKVLSLVLTLALLIIGAVAVTASAEEAPTLKIASKNLSYDSNISIMFAVETANTTEAPKLNVYTMENDTLTFKETVSATYTPENSYEKVGYADAYIFFTPGVVAKALDTEIYVQAVIGETKSAMERYSVVEYCHEMNAKKETTLYTNIITYGATVQQMLKEDGKFDGALATEYKYVTIDGGTLDGTYDSGIYLKGESVYPQADGATSWLASDGKTVENKGEYVVGDTNVSFTETIVITYREGTFDFESMDVGTNVKPSRANGWGQFGMGVDSSFGYGCVEETVYGSTSKVFKATPSVVNKAVTLYHTDPDVTCDLNNNRVLSNREGADGFEVSFDFRFDSETTTAFKMLIDTKSAAVFQIGFKSSDNGVTFYNNVDAEETVTLFGGATSGYNHIAFRVVSKDNALVCELWANGKHVYDFAKQSSACTDLGIFCHARIYSTGEVGPIYFDNVYVGYYND